MVGFWLSKLEYKIHDVSGAYRRRVHNAQRLGCLHAPSRFPSGLMVARVCVSLGGVRPHGRREVNLELHQLGPLDAGEACPAV